MLYMTIGMPNGYRFEQPSAQMGNHEVVVIEVGGRGCGVVLVVIICGWYLLSIHVPNFCC